MNKRKIQAKKKTKLHKFFGFQFYITSSHFLNKIKKKFHSEINQKNALGVTVKFRKIF
jgi:hypothetical protein